MACGAELIGQQVDQPVPADAGEPIVQPLVPTPPSPPGLPAPLAPTPAPQPRPVIVNTNRFVGRPLPVIRPGAPGQPGGIVAPSPLVRPGTGTPVQATAGRVLAPFPLVFDGEHKEITAEPGATNVVFTFLFTNTTPTEVTIERVHTSCGCTAPRLPALPWRLPAGTNGSFEVAMDVRGKRGQLSKSVYVYTSQGFKSLLVKAVLPAAGMIAADRMRNMQLAAADRQAVFRGDCARCHADPAHGKSGRELFQAVCAVCHEAEHRADMVPDLRLLKHPTDEAHWRQWATHGKSGTLMPAFSDSEGGPLNAAQIDSLVEYLSARFRSPVPGPIPRTPAPPSVR